MFSIELECDSAHKDLLIAELWEAGSAGIVELDRGALRAFFDDDSARAALAERFHAVSCREEEQRDWIEESRAGFEPLAVGRRFYLVPEWRADPAPGGRFRIAVNPGMAFGTGRHETTQLCLEAFETWLRPGAQVLDVGTGCGILAHAAALLGARAVYACDIDPEAVSIARGMAGANVFTGSVDAVRAGSADLVAANISPEAIIALAPQLMRALAPDGVLLASGFERQEIVAVAGALTSFGGTILEARHKGTWALLAVGVTLDGGAGHVDEQKAVS